MQNLQKRAGLGGDLIEKYNPDVLLAQEINLKSEDQGLFGAAASYVSKFGYGTSICDGTSPPSHVRRVKSPHAETGGFVYKKTTIATTCFSLNDPTTIAATIDGDWCHVIKIDCVSFHGYNGQPRKIVSNLVDHVRAARAALDDTGPAIFAGDFNTWTPEHLAAVSTELEKSGFQLAHSWKYPGKDTSLDHVFVRELQVQSFTTFSNSSDHDGAVFEVHVVPSLPPGKHQETQQDEGTTS